MDVPLAVAMECEPFQQRKFESLHPTHCRVWSDARREAAVLDWIRHNNNNKKRQKEKSLTKHVSTHTKIGSSEIRACAKIVRVKERGREEKRIEEKRWEKHVIWLTRLTSTYLLSVQRDSGLATEIPSIYNSIWALLRLHSPSSLFVCTLFLIPSSKILVSKN